MPVTVCEKCGKELVEGDWPFCPHPKRERDVSINGDEIVGGVTLENWGPNPVTFYSKTEMRRYAKEKGIVIREKFSPAPGTDVDPAGIPNPKGYMDAATLANAAVLVTRTSKVKVEETPDVDVTVIQGELEGHTLGDVLAGDTKAQSRLHRRTTGGR